MDHDNIYERRHSCKWYFDEAKDAYDKIFGLGKHTEDLQQALIRKICDEGLFKDQYVNYLDYAKKRSNDPLLGKSLFPLFVVPIDTVEDGAQPDEVFERKKFEICKVLDAIDAIVDRICGNSMEGIFAESDDGHFVGRETVLKWLFARKDIPTFGQQDKDRSVEYCMQIYKWLIGQLKRSNDKALLSKANSAKEEAEKSRFELGTEEEEHKFILAMRENLGLTIDDIHEFYHSLNGFRKYAVRADLAKEEMKNPTDLNKLLALANAILKFFLSVCSTYMRIDRLKLPRGEFANARLRYSNISNSNFASSDFSEVDISRGQAKDCDFSRSTLRNIYAKETDFSGSLFSYTDLAGAMFEGANLSKAKIDYANFGKINISRLQYKLKDAVTSKGYLAKTASTKDIGGIEEKAGEVIAQHNGDPLGEDYIFVKPESIAKDFVHTVESKINLCGLSLSYTEKEREDIVETIREAESKIQNDRLASQVPTEKACFTNVTADELLMPSADLSLIKLNNASFKGAILSDSVASYANASGSSFARANLYHSFFYKSDFSHAAFEKTAFGESVLADCDLRSSVFNGANLSRTLIVGADTHHYVTELTKPYRGYVKKDEPVPFSCSRGVESYEATQQLDKERSMRGSTAIGLNATGIVIANYSLARSSFNESDFRNAVFFNCDLSSTCFDGANLTFSLQRDVLYARSSFKNASLQESRFRDCDFSMCNFANCRAFNSNFEHVVFSAAYTQGANFTESTFDRCVFEGTLHGAMVNRSIFRDCLFIDIDFDDVSGLYSAKFENCMFVNVRRSGKELKATNTGTAESVESSLVIAKNGKTLTAKGDNLFAKYSG